MGLNLIERKEKLEKLVGKSKPGRALQFSEHITGNGREMLANKTAPSALTALAFRHREPVFLPTQPRKRSRP